MRTFGLVETSCLISQDIALALLLAKRFLTTVIDRVVTSPFESECLGWIGERIAKHAGHGVEHMVIGYVFPGFNIHGDFEWISAPDGWAFITVRQRNGVAFTIGWSNTHIDPRLCESMAG